MFRLQSKKIPEPPVAFWSLPTKWPSYLSALFSMAEFPFAASCLIVVMTEFLFATFSATFSSLVVIMAPDGVSAMAGTLLWSEFLEWREVPLDDRDFLGDLDLCRFFLFSDVFSSLSRMELKFKTKIKAKYAALGQYNYIIYLYCFCWNLKHYIAKHIFHIRNASLYMSPIISFMYVLITNTVDDKSDGYDPLSSHIPCTVI